MTLSKTSFVAALVALIALSIAPAAGAQGLPTAPDLTDTVGNVGGGITDTVDETTDGVTDTVGNTTDEATDVVDETTGTVGAVTDDTTDTVDNTTGGATGGVTDQVDNTTGSVGNTVGGATDTVDETTNGDGGALDTVDNTTGSLSGSGGERSGSLVDDFFGNATGGTTPSLDNLAPGLLDDLVEEAAANGLSPAAAEGWIEGKKTLGGLAYRNPSSLVYSFETVLGDFAMDMTDGVSTSVGGVTLSSPAPRDSFFDSAGRAATAVAKALAFPLALALLVVGFLAIQGKIGRKDPKLVLAPVDASHETLTFE